MIVKYHCAVHYNLFSFFFNQVALAILILTWLIVLFYHYLWHLHTRLSHSADCSPCLILCFFVPFYAGAINSNGLLKIQWILCSLFTGLKFHNCHHRHEVHIADERWLLHWANKNLPTQGPVSQRFHKNVCTQEAIANLKACDYRAFLIMYS